MEWMKELDYQWENLPSSNIEYTEERVEELLQSTKLPSAFFRGKLCLDAGCGNGRYSYAMLHSGAKAVSLDISEKAVEPCRKTNPEAYVFDLMDLTLNLIFDFVLCWGVLHHLPVTRNGFKKVASQVKSGDILHIMVYHRKTQKIYEEGRRIWHKLSIGKKINLCREMIMKHGGNLHG